MLFDYCGFVYNLIIADLFSTSGNIRIEGILATARRMRGNFGMQVKPQPLIYIP